MLTPTVKELPRSLEPVGRDTFLAGSDHAATLTLVAGTRSSSERDVLAGRPSLAAQLAA